MSSLAQGNVTPAVPFPIDNYATSAATTLNITAATVVKAAPGRLVQIDVIVAGSTPGSVNDCTTIGAVAAGNKVAVIPNAVGAININWPMQAGITITPGTGMTLSVGWY